MANIRLYQFPTKASPVPADIVYVGDSAAAFDEVQCTIAQLISAYPNLSGIGGLTLGANTYPWVNGSSVWTAGSVTPSPTASVLSAWDANKNLSANNFLSGYATTATAAATTTLTVASAYQQFFTGVTTQTVTLPVTSTLVLGQTFLIVNNSTGVVTVNSSGANLVKAMASNTTLLVTCILTSGTTAASWNVDSGELVLPVSLANGGTNAALTASNGGIFYSTATAGAILSGTATANQVLLSGASGAPAWSTTTYLQTITGGSLVYGGSNNVMAGLAIGSTAQFLTISGGLPVWSTATLPATATGTGTMLRADGTNWVASTSTFADTYGASTILYSNGANTVSGLATAISATLRTNSSGVPVMSTANIAISASCGLFVGGVGAGPTQITNLSVTITTLGRPVMVMLVDDGSTNGSCLFASAGGSGVIYFFDGATKLTAQVFNNTATYLPVSSFSFIYTPSSGSHTITAQYSNAVNNINVSYAKLVAYEM